MSDLQCPANVVLASRDMLPALAYERFSGVFVAPAIAAYASELAAARSFAKQVNCALDTLTGALDAASCRLALQDLSDVYRGETVVVIAPRELIHDLLGRAADAAQPSVVAIDSSGWVVTHYSAKSPLASG